MKEFLKKIVITILTLEARVVLRTYKPKIVAITGSVGKTSTKDAIFSVLAKTTHVRKSEKSYNSEIGLPLTILGLQNAWGNPLRWMQNIFDGLLLIVMRGTYPEWLVLEIGADRPGDIRSLVNWLKVDIAVITRLPETPVHVEFFDSPEAVVEEKAALIECIRPGGTLLLYADDPHTRALERHEPFPDARVLLFGFNADADVRASDFALVRAQPVGRKKGMPVGMRATITVEGESAPVEIAGTVGTHSFLSGVAAAAVGHTLGLPLQTILEGLAGYEPPPGRMRLLPGLKGSLIIDDTYNSSPAAVEAALETLTLINPKRAIVVLGDMLELGRHSVDAHRKAGAQAAKVCDLLVTIGFRARDIAQGALDNRLRDEKIFQYEDARKAGADLKNWVGEGDVVLVKGSQSMRMERVVEELMLEPERARELLVRQDAEWKRR
mgnify:CR=1 FL=1